MRISREISVGHILQAIVLFVTLVVGIVSMSGDRKRIIETQKDMIEWQKHQDERLYELEMWRGRVELKYPLTPDRGEMR